MDNSEFLEGLRQSVMRRASTSHLVDTMAFVAEVAERLSDAPVFGDFIQTEYSGTGFRNRGIRLHGFTQLDESDGTIGIVLGRWNDSEDIETFSTLTAEQMASNLESFVDEALNRGLEERITESNPAYELAQTLNSNRSRINRIRLHLFSNEATSSRFREERGELVAGIQIERHIWDLNRLRTLYESSLEREPLEIELADIGIPGIPCLEASQADSLRSFLCVIDGKTLADMFESWGSRLLEGNVRSFLGMKGGVNKGIRSTVRDCPQLFFAYNNGIAATAAGVTLDNIGGQLMITRIHDLQIVNGGQTTASILSARKKDGLSLAGVFVPMKLTVVSERQAHDLIPKIAQFANTQNKIAAADFFANHPFHTKMEEISRRLVIPAQAGVRVQSKWFYERSRGQYQNERLYKRDPEKRAFDLEYPKEQLVNKTDLAKYDSVIELKPWWVSLGAQKNFIKFADKFSPKSADKSDSEHWEEISPRYGEAYYQDIVALAVLWSQAENIVSKAKSDWYEGGYRPQIVAFTLARLFQSARDAGMEFDLRRIWHAQAADVSTLQWIAKTAPDVQRVILSPPRGMTNVGEWTKKEDCWKQVLRTQTAEVGLLGMSVIERDERKKQEREDKKLGALDDNITMQSEVYRLTESGYWSSLLNWGYLAAFTTQAERTLLTKARTVSGVYGINRPSDWKLLLKIRDRCCSEGFKFH